MSSGIGTLLRPCRPQAASTLRSPGSSAPLPSPSPPLSIKPAPRPTTVPPVPADALASPRLHEMNTPGCSLPLGGLLHGVPGHSYILLLTTVARSTSSGLFVDKSSYTVNHISRAFSVPMLEGTRLLPLGASVCTAARNTGAQSLHLRCFTPPVQTAGEE